MERVMNLKAPMKLIMPMLTMAMATISSTRVTPRLSLIMGKAGSDAHRPRQAMARSCGKYRGFTRGGQGDYDHRAGGTQRRERRAFCQPGKPGSSSQIEATPAPQMMRFSRN